MRTHSTRAKPYSTGRVKSKANGRRSSCLGSAMLTRPSWREAFRSYLEILRVTGLDFLGVLLECGRLGGHQLDVGQGRGPGPLSDLGMERVLGGGIGQQLVRLAREHEALEQLGGIRIGSALEDGVGAG